MKIEIRGAKAPRGRQIPPHTLPVDLKLFASNDSLTFLTKVESEWKWKTFDNDR